MPASSIPGQDERIGLNFVDKHDGLAKNFGSEGKNHRLTDRCDAKGSDAAANWRATPLRTATGKYLDEEEYSLALFEAAGSLDEANAVDDVLRSVERCLGPGDWQSIG